MNPSSLVIRNSSFAQAPLLMPRRAVLACGVPEKALRWLLAARAPETGPGKMPGALLRVLRPHGPKGKAFYLKRDLAPHLGQPMDWTEFDRWPPHLLRGHLYRAGLTDWAIQWLETTGQLSHVEGRNRGRNRRWYKWRLGQLIGYECKSAQFTAAPLLMSQRSVFACGFTPRALRWLLRMKAVRAVCPGKYRFYVKADLATHLGQAMDWTEFERWPPHLKRYHLLRAGLNDEAINALAASGQFSPVNAKLARLGLRRQKGERDRRWFKWQFAKLVGYE